MHEVAIVEGNRYKDKKFFKAISVNYSDINNTKKVVRQNNAIDSILCKNINEKNFLRSTLNISTGCSEF